MAQLTYTVKEAAEALGLSERTVYELVYKKKIPFRRIEARGKHKQGKILFSVKALEEWLAGEAVDPHLQDDRALRLARR